MSDIPKIAEFMAERLKPVYSSDDFSQVMILGSKRSGKSTLALWIGYLIVGSWERVLERSLVFTMGELLDALDRKERLIIWDDAGIHGSAYKWFSKGERIVAIKLAEEWDVIGTDTRVLILTAPTKARLLSFIRSEPEGWLLMVWKKYDNGRKKAVGRLYKITTDPWDTKPRRKRIKSFGFVPRLPAWVYEEYMERRLSYGKEAKAKLRLLLRTEAEPDNIYRIPEDRV